MTAERGNSSERTPEGMAAALLAHGITPTRQRLEIASILLDRPQHLSAEQVLARLQESGRQVSKATVYNTLGLFSRRGLVREVIVDPQRVFYDSNSAAHHHLYEVDTGRLLDISPAAVSIGALPALPAGTVVEGIDVVVRVRRRPGASDPAGADPPGV